MNVEHQQLPEVVLSTASRATSSGTTDLSCLEPILADLGELDAAVAHDLRSGMGVIAGYGSLLAKRLEAGLDATSRGHISAMSEMAGEAIALVSAWREAGEELRRPLTRAPLDMESVVRRLTLETSVGVVRLTFAPGLPQVHADRAMVEWIWQELLANARKFKADGKEPIVEIFAELRNHEWVFGARDEGIGLPPDDLERLFRPLQRLHGEEYAGAGLGLFVASRLIARHGGRMWAENASGAGVALLGGTSFCFTLPNSNVAG